MEKERHDASRFDAYEQVEDDIEETKSPLQYFKQFWPDEINDLVVEQSSFYRTQKSGTSINTSTNQMEKFIGMHIKMGVIRLPSYKLYWSQKLRYPAIANQMPHLLVSNQDQDKEMVYQDILTPSQNGECKCLAPLLQAL